MGGKFPISVQGNDCWVGRSKPIMSSLIHFSALIVVRSREFINADARRCGRGGRGVVGVLWQNSRAQNCRISAFARMTYCAAFSSSADCRMHDEDAYLDRTLR